MKILPNELPKKERKQVKRVYNQKSGNVGRKPQYNWAELAPKLKGKSKRAASKIVGCSRSTIDYAHNKGWIDLEGD